MIQETGVQLIPKTQKLVLAVSLLKTQHSMIQINVKCCNPEKGLAPSLLLAVVAFEKEPFIGLDYSRSTAIYIYIYIYIYKVP